MLCLQAVKVAPPGDGLTLAVGGDMHDPKPSPRPPDVPQLAKPPPPAAAPTGVPTRANQEPAGAIASSEAEGGERTSKEGRTGGNTRGTAVAAPATPAASTRNPTTATTPATAAPRPPVSEQQAQEEVGHQGGVEEEGEGDAPAPPPQGAPLEEVGCLSCLCQMTRVGSVRMRSKTLNQQVLWVPGI
jgi:hypothetical protein